MHITLVQISVKPEHIQDFIAASEANHLASIQEPGNLRFDVLQSADDLTQFVLYEAYAHDTDALAHKQTAHYLAWRDAVGDWMATPRRGIPYIGLFPTDENQS